MGDQRKPKGPGRTVTIVKKETPATPVARLTEHLPKLPQRQRKDPAAKPTRPQTEGTVFSRFLNDLHAPLDGMSWFRWIVLLPRSKRLIQQAASAVEALWLLKGLNIVSGNKRGSAGKTQLVAALATILGWVTQKAVCAFDFNPNGGHILNRLGISLRKVFFRTLLEDPTPIESHDALDEGLIGSHPDRGLHSVYCIGWNNPENSDKNTELNNLPEEKVAELLKNARKPFHSTLIDLGNSLTDSWTRAAVKYDPERSVVLIPFNPHQEDSESDAKETFEAWKRHDPKVINRTIIVASGFQGRKPQELIERCAKWSGLPEERVVIIPFDPVFLSLKTSKADEMQPVRVVNPKRFRLRTLLAYLKLLILIAEVSAAYRDPQPQDTVRSLASPDEPDSVPLPTRPQDEDQALTGSDPNTNPWGVLDREPTHSTL